MPEYVILTPVHPKKKVSIPAFKKGIDRLEPPPAAVGIVTSRSVYEEFFSAPGYILVTEHPPLKSDSDDSQPRKYRRKLVSYCREKLRSWFEKKRAEEYLWWIDSDIEVFEHTFKKIMEKMKKEKALGICNGYQGRGQAGNWHATGCFLLSRKVVGLVRHYVPTLVDGSGEENWLCDDLVVLSTLHGLAQPLLNYHFPDYNNVIVEEDVARVIHHIKDFDCDENYDFETIYTNETDYPTVKRERIRQRKKEVLKRREG